VPECISNQPIPIVLEETMHYCYDGGKGNADWEGIWEKEMKE
jgi:hypothetical protein